MPCCESETPQNSAGYIQTPLDHGTSSVQSQRGSIVSTQNETYTRLCIESTLSKLPSIDHLKMSNEDVDTVMDKLSESIHNSDI